MEALIFPVLYLIAMLGDWIVGGWRDSDPWRAE